MMRPHICELAMFNKCVKGEFHFNILDGQEGRNVIAPFLPKNVSFLISLFLNKMF